MNTSTAPSRLDWAVPDRFTMTRFRARQWEDHPLAEFLGEVFALLAHAPRAGQDFLDIHASDPRQRIERVIATCASALQDRPQLAPRLRQIVPALAQEKLRRNGLDPSQISVMNFALSKKVSPTPC